MSSFVGYRAVAFPLRAFQKLTAGKPVFALIHKFLSSKLTTSINQTRILLKTILISPQANNDFKISAILVMGFLHIVRAGNEGAALTAGNTQQLMREIAGTFSWGKQVLDCKVSDRHPCFPDDGCYEVTALSLGRYPWHRRR